MLSVLKNSVVSEANLHQAELRQRELDFYVGNFWIWGGTTVILAGFALAQLTREIPKGTPLLLELAYLASTAVCLSLDLCIVTWTVLVCTWGPGSALRGPNGMKSFHETLALLKEEQLSIYNAFVVSIVAYFSSSCCLLWELEPLLRGRLEEAEAEVLEESRMGRRALQRQQRQYQAREREVELVAEESVELQRLGQQHLEEAEQRIAVTKEQLQKAREDKMAERQRFERQLEKLKSELSEQRQLTEAIEKEKSHVELGGSRQSQEHTSKIRNLRSMSKQLSFQLEASEQRIESLESTSESHVNNLASSEAAAQQHRELLEERAQAAESWGQEPGQAPAERGGAAPAAAPGARGTPQEEPRASGGGSGLQLEADACRGTAGGRDPGHGRSSGGARTLRAPRRGGAAGGPRDTRLHRGVQGGGGIGAGERGDPRQ
ncbi:unnamed protein product [Effrenium voratum]|uniref:Uncharacterized protein n=1 Tax=Effrenium voratum TaxID=2562239 RepID=A0AA36ICK5_9DINO|nr:unnamed protein product [Effrenium voratum]